MAALPGLDKRFPALIFKASRGTIHHGAVGIARSLGRAGVPVYAIVEDRYTPLAVSRYVTRAFIWKRWPGERKAFLSAMSAIGEIINQPTVLIPMDDLSAVYVAENASILKFDGFYAHSYRQISHVNWPTKRSYTLCVPRLAFHTHAVWFHTQRMTFIASPNKQHSQS